MEEIKIKCLGMGFLKIIYEKIAKKYKIQNIDKKKWKNIVVT